MLDIRKIKENPDAVKAGLKAKEVDCDAIIDKILELDIQVRALKTSTEAKTAQKNKLSKENGKLDRKALPDIEGRSEREYVAPRNETEEIICAVFSEILGVEKVGVKDNFFELGGHSLRATRLVNQIEAKTGCRIALKDVFSNPSVEKLAELASGSKAEEYVPIPKAEEKEYYAQVAPNTVTASPWCIFFHSSLLPLSFSLIV